MQNETGKTEGAFSSVVTEEGNLWPESKEEGDEVLEEGVAGPYGCGRGGSTASLGTQG